MNTKLKSTDSRLLLIAKGTPLNLKPLERLTEILSRSTKPKKYVITLKPISKKINSEGKPETRKVLISAEDVLKGKCMFDTKFTAKTSILDKIDESVENSKLSIESENFELKVSQALTKLSRLCGGAGKRTERKSGGKDHNTTSENKDTIKETKDFVLGKDTQEGTREIQYRNDQKEEEKKKKILADNSSEIQKGNHYVNFSSKVAEGIKFEDDQKQEKKNEVSANNTNEKSKANKYEDLLLPAYNDDFQPAFVAERSKHTSHKFEDINSNIRSKEEDITNVTNEANHVDRNELLTTSFIVDLLSETVLDSKKQLLLPPPTEFAPQKIKPTELFPILPPNDEICKRIENLEQQVGQINSALKDLQNELVPPDDLAKFNVISRRFDEVNNVLAELKFNCVKLKNVESRINERGYPSIIEENQQPVLNLNSNNYDEFAGPQMYLEPCNCKIYSGEESCGHGGTCRLRLNYYNAPIPRLAVHSQHQNHRSRQHQQDVTDKSAFETFSQQKNYKTLPSDLHKHLSPMNSRFHHSKKANPLSKSRQPAEDNKNVSTVSNTLNDTSSQWTEAKRARSPKANSHSMPHQRSLSEPRQTFSASPSKKEIRSSNNDTNNYNDQYDYKEFSSQPKEYLNKTRHSAGKEILGNDSDGYIADSSTRVTKSNTYQELPLVTHNLNNVIWNIIGNTSADNIALTVFLESNNLYHINIAVIQTGQCLGCVYTNEAAFEEAKKNKLFENFFVFLVLNSDNTLEERNKVLGYSFEFINIKD